MKKLLTLCTATLLSLSLLTACGGDDTSAPADDTSAPATDDASAPADDSAAQATGLITVITREDGSGTRGAFTEITGIDNGEDRTTLEASVQDGTGKVMTAVAADPQAIGYISLGSLDESVKAVSVDGVEPTVENINAGTYSVARPFNIATAKGAELDAVTTEFLAFAFTAEGQAIVEGEGFIPVEATTTEFVSATPEGTITIGGSTSVTPVVEKLIEAYKVLNPNATINLESQGSTAGMVGAQDGTFQIGMASRALKAEEADVLDAYVLAMDGIAVVVNNENPLENLTMDQIVQIFIGEAMDYADIG